MPQCCARAAPKPRSRTHTPTADVRCAAVPNGTFPTDPYGSVWQSGTRDSRCQDNFSALADHRRRRVASPAPPLFSTRARPARRAAPSRAPEPAHRTVRRKTRFGSPRRSGLHPLRSARPRALRGARTGNTRPRPPAPGSPPGRRQACPPPTGAPPSSGAPAAGCPRSRCGDVTEAPRAEAPRSNERPRWRTAYGPQGAIGSARP